MKLMFDIGGTPAEFSRNCFTGRCTLTTGAATKELQSPFNPRTHFSITLQRHWQLSVNGHDVLIEKQRPLLLAGLRPQTIRIFVDGNLVREKTGF
jgi:hypothetical protein